MPTRTARAAVAALAIAVALAGCGGAAGTVVASGALPDGTLFEVTGDGPAEDVTGIFVAIVMDIDDGANAIGVLTVHDESERCQTCVPPWPSDRDQRESEGGPLIIRAGKWHVRLQPYDHVLDHLGREARQQIADAVRVVAVDGLPVFDLSPPLRLPTDEELPFQIGVSYETFEVRRGCVEVPEAICSANGCTHILPMSLLYLPMPQQGMDPSLSITAECPQAAESNADASSATGNHSQRWSIAMLDGSIVEIKGLPEMHGAAATWFSVVVFPSVSIEFTAGELSLGEFVRTWDEADLGPASGVGEAMLSVGTFQGTDSIALWEGDGYSAMTTLGGSHRPAKLEGLVRRLGFAERADGVVLELPSGVAFDEGRTSLYQPLAGIGGLEVRRRAIGDRALLTGAEEAVAGGSLIPLAGRSGLALVTDTAVASLTVEDQSLWDEGYALMSQLQVSWLPPDRGAG